MKFYQIILAVAALFIMASCNNQTDGGGCTYHIDTIPATLVELVEINDKSYDALFEVEYEGRKDTLSFAQKNNRQYIFLEERPKSTLVAGKQYQYIVKKIISGQVTLLLM